MNITHMFEVNQPVWILDIENSTVLPCRVLQVLIRIADTEEISYILITNCGKTKVVLEENIYGTLNDALSALGALL